MDRLLVTTCVIILAALSACEREDHARSLPARGSGPEALPVSTGVQLPDPMEMAVDTAREELDLFIAALQNPKPYQVYFSVKTPVPLDDSAEPRFEEVWLNNIRFEDGQFTGSVRDEPVEAKVRPGDLVTLTREEISDWMIIENDLLVGGFTIRALRDQMDDSDRRRFDATFPFTIE